MTITLTRDTLYLPLQRVIGVVERKQTQPVLANVLLRWQHSNLTLTTTDNDVELLAVTQAEPVSSALEATLPARKLLDICRSLPVEAEIKLTFQDNQVVLQANRSRFTLVTLPAADFPLIATQPAEIELSIPSLAFAHLLECTAFAVAQNDVRYYLNGLLLALQPDAIVAVATDGHRLAYAEYAQQCPTEQASMQCIVPRKAIMELLRLFKSNQDSTLTLSLCPQHLRVQVCDTALTCKLIDGRFPDYQRVIPLGADKCLPLSRQDLIKALSRVAILSNEKYHGVRFSFEPGRVLISATNPEQEVAEEELEVNYQGETFDIAFNVTYLLDALQAFTCEIVQLHLSGPAQSVMLDAPDGRAGQRYVVMPMRL